MDNWYIKKHFWNAIIYDCIPEPAVAQHTEVYGSKSKPEVVI